jgi:hypothetical protein
MAVLVTAVPPSLGSILLSTIITYLISSLLLEILLLLIWQ